MRIQHNIPAMNSYRNYTNNTSALAKNLEKLSSGYKINRAGDDAAGLAISEKMRAQITGLEVAQKNAKDGISLVQTAEGALTEVHDMLNRMYELAEQSANGTYDDEVDRAQLQKEITSLSSEIDRIADSSNFNGIKLLDGSLAGGTSGAGGLTGAQIASFKGAETSAINGADASVASVTAVKEVVEYDFTGKLLEDGNSFAVGGVTITATNSGGHVFGDANGANDSKVDISDATDAAGQAQAIADILNSKTEVAGAKDWNWSVSGTKLIATAKTAGAAGSQGPTALSSDSGTKTISAVVATRGVDQAGIDFSVTDTVNVDGVDIKVDWSSLTDDEKAVLQKDFAASATGANADDVKKAAKLIQDTINKAIDKTNSEKGTSVAHIKVEGTEGDGVTAADSFKFISGQKDGGSGIKFQGTTYSTLGQIVGTAANASAAPATSLSFNPADISGGKFTMNIGGENVEVALGALTADSTAQDVVDALNTAVTTALGNYDTAHGLTGADALSGKITAKLNDKGALEFTNNSGESISFEDKGDGEIAKTLGIASGSGAVSTGGLTLQIGDTADDFNKLTVSVKDMHVSAMGIGNIDISKQDGASNAMAKVKDAINYVSDVRGTLGATQNRLDHTINNLSVMQENIQDAESSIRDVDVAKEMMEYTKNNILVQSAQAMLAQANQLPQGVLQLLQ